MVLRRALMSRAQQTRGQKGTLYYRSKGKGTYSTTGALEGGQVGHLLDRRNDRLQTLHIPILADVVVCQTVHRRTGGKQKQ